ncbi:hypothetical protein [Pseudarthrobacter sp. NamB4]|uniref:hypothetical protein n=1 Tax=Pseudarthrobacter sp. NamB4 TaxID=2576837 RepID=UPI001F118FDF|nr:hypothetical protein [Pseudarthrobacter sp. NamB4]
MLGRVTSSVSTLSDKAISPVPAAPAATQPSGLLQPVVGSAAGLADDIVSTVPIINQVVPAGTVFTVIAPIAQLADGATTVVVETVVPPVAETVPDLEPVLDPVTDLVTGKTPVPAPALPGQVGDDGGLPARPDSAPAEGTETDSGSTADTGDTAQGNGSVSPAAAEASSLDDSGAETSSQSSDTRSGGSGPAAGPTSPWPASMALSVTSQSAGAVDPAPSPGPSPAAPGISGTGSGASSAAGGSGSAAWLNPFDFHLPLPGSSQAGELSEHTPAPVSYDPGSSPD